MKDDQKTISRRNILKLLGVGLTALALPLSLLGHNVFKGLDSRKKAWKSLSEFATNRFSFRDIEPKKELVKLFIYGDSILIGYSEYARVSLKYKASVYRLHLIAFYPK